MTLRDLTEIVGEVILFLIAAIIALFLLALFIGMLVFFVLAGTSLLTTGRLP